MTRILFLGDVEATGFGTVTHDLGKALLALGEDVRFISQNETPDNLPEVFRGRTVATESWLGIPRTPEDAQRVVAKLSGMFTGRTWKDGWEPQAAIILGDVGSLEVSPIPMLIPRGLPTFHYVPIEGIGLPPSWADIWADVISPVAMTRFGAEQLATILPAEPPFAYHGVDAEAFHPVAERPITLHGKTKAGQPATTELRSKADCRRAFGLPDDAIVMFRADRFMPRKNYASLLRSAAPVLREHREAILLVHCRMQDQGGNMAHELSKYPDLVSRGQIRQTGFFRDGFSGVPRSVLVALYNAADIYVSTSAEGFGLTIAEALACGLPAVGIDYSAVPEVIGPAGVVVPVGGLVDNIYAHFWALPDEAAYTDALLRLVRSRKARRELGSLGPTHVRDTFAWSKAADTFSGLIARSQLQVAA